MSARRSTAVAVAVAAVILAGATRVPAQPLANVRLTGSIESDVGEDTVTVGSTRWRTFSWGSRYAPNLDGYVLDPRLFLYSYSGSWMDRRTDDTGGGSESLTVEPYRASVTLFPYGLHTFNLSAGRFTSDFDYEAGRISTSTDTMGADWTYRGGAVTPETTLRLAREAIDETQLDGTTRERTRSTLGLRLHREFERLRPTLDYTVEDKRLGGTATSFGLEEGGITHRVRLDDRVRLGAQAVLAPQLDFTRAPERREGNANVTMSGPVSPTVDASGGVRYSFSERTAEDDATRIQVTALQGQATKRFASDLTLTTVANGTFVTDSSSGDAWATGAGAALRAAPLTHLRGLGDYALQFSTSDASTSVSHRGHLNLVSTVVPRHTFTGDYFASLIDTSGPIGPFVSHTGALGLTSEAIPLTVVSGGYTLERQEGFGTRERRVARLGADVRPAPPLLARASAEHFQEHSEGGGQTRREETGVVGEGGVTVRAFDWLQAGLTGRYGAKDVEREDRTGSMGTTSVIASLDASLGTLFLHLEGFTERDQDARQQREGGRGTLSYRFRVWTIAADFEFSNLTLQGVATGRERFFLRISRPVNFSWP